MSSFHSYVRTGRDTIEGWLSRVDAEIIYELLTWQNRNGLGGGVGEIGLHHGKCFVALCLGLEPGQKAYGIDLFENQALNVDKSGAGKRGIVIENLQRFGVSQDSYILDARSSEVVTAADIVQGTGRIRFFSVDGGHWRKIVQNDLALAERVLADGGIIALDDFHRPEWPDVSLGFFDWYEASSQQIAPVAIGFNKLYLCDRASIPAYRTALENSAFLKHFLSKHYDFLGNRIPIFQTYPLPEWRKSTFLKESLKLRLPELYIRLFGSR